MEKRTILTINVNFWFENNKNKTLKDKNHNLINIKGYNLYF